MDARMAYRAMMRSLEGIPGRMDLAKTIAAEDVAIARKRSIWQQVEWSCDQRNEFDSYWLQVYGRRIPDWWHRLYQAQSGCFALDYIPEKLYSTRIEPRFNDRRYAVVLQDKSLIETLSTGAGCVVPDTVLVCSGGRYFDGNRRPIAHSAAERLLAERDGLVAKPSVGTSSGQKLLFLSRDNSIESTMRAMEGLGDDWIVQERIVQHSSFAALNGSTVNTLRVITYLCDGEVYHAPIVMRMGRSGSTVDNIHAGGLCVGVRDDGSLLHSAYELGYGDKTTTLEAHPDTGVTFDAHHLEGVTEVLRCACELHGRFAHIGIISWDFTVDSSENPVIIEANIRGQSVWFPQVVHGKGLFGEHTEQILKMIRK